MKIALICLAKPETGTGNGTTEYSYQLMERLKKISGNHVDVYYGIKKSMRYDVSGFMKMRLFFPNEIKEIAKMDYDIIHITIQELGFAAKILKKKKSKAVVITTVHDLLRFSDELYEGILQKGYNKLVKQSVNDAIKYSDFITFNSAQTQEEVTAKFGKLKNSKLIWHGSRMAFVKTKLPTKRVGKNFVVGYIGALGSHKNVISILKIARKIHKNKFKFLIYGTGMEHKNIAKYKDEYQIDNVKLMGFISESKIIQTYDSFDAFILPSLYEGLSHQVLEARARGLPVIVYKKAKIPEEIKRYCLETEDEFTATKLLKKLYKYGYDDKLRKKSIAHSRKFTWDRTVKQTYQVYKMLTK